MPGGWRVGGRPHRPSVRLTTDALCQKQGQTVSDPAVGTNNWWTAVMEFSGSDLAWVNNLYIRGGQKIAGVPDC